MQTAVTQCRIDAEATTYIDPERASPAGLFPTNTSISGGWIHYRNSNIPLSIPQMTLLQLALILGTLSVFIVYWSGHRQRPHLPPGPKKLPFIGNLLSMPSIVEWETYAKWGKEYSLCLIPPAQYSSHALHRTPTLFTSTL